MLNIALISTIINSSGYEIGSILQKEKDKDKIVYLRTLIKLFSTLGNRCHLLMIGKISHAEEWKHISTNLAGP